MISETSGCVITVTDLSQILCQIRVFDIVSGVAELVLI